EQQGPVGGEGGDRDLDDAPRTHVLGGDHRAVGQGAAEEVGRHGPRRELPVGRPRTVVLGGQRREFRGEGVLGVRPQHRRGGIGRRGGNGRRGRAERGPGGVGARGRGAVPTRGVGRRFNGYGHG